jgi:hypothetical protein
VTPGDARRFIDSHFRRSVFTDSAGDSIAHENFVEVLDAIDKLIPFADGKQNENLKRFLWSGCRKFNRWFGPSPFVVPAHFEISHARFAEALLRSARGVPDNAAVYLMHAVRDTLYHTLNAVPLPLSQEQLREIESLLKRAESIREPSHEIKRNEFSNERDTLYALIRGLRTGELRTLCSFSLPYPLVRRPLMFELSWNGIRVEGKLLPTFTQPAGFMSQGMPPTVIVPAVSSRWQFGATQIDLKLTALIDHGAEVEPLQLPMEPLPLSGWPNIFRLTFQLTYESLWRLRDRDDYIGKWVPSPSDMSDIEYRITVPGHADINIIRKGNPALLSIGFIPATEPDAVPANLGAIGSTEWYAKCRILAEQYLTLGDTREALFWLNVGVESLLQERMRSILMQAGATITEADLKGAPSYWDAAKSLMLEQYPDLAETIKWPETAPIVPSMFRRINFLGKHVKLSRPSREITTNYARIQRDRNSLFHGENETPISANAVKSAIESFDWLVANFRMASST